MKSKKTQCSGFVRRVTMGFRRPHPLHLPTPPPPWSKFIFEQHLLLLLLLPLEKVHRTNLWVKHNLQMLLHNLDRGFHQLLRELQHLRQVVRRRHTDGAHPQLHHNLLRRRHDPLHRDLVLFLLVLTLLLGLHSSSRGRRHRRRCRRRCCCGRHHVRRLLHCRCREGPLRSVCRHLLDEGRAGRGGRAGRSSRSGGCCGHHSRRRRRRRRGGLCRRSLRRLLRSRRLLRGVGGGGCRRGLQRPLRAPGLLLLRQLLLLREAHLLGLRRNLHLSLLFVPAERFVACVDDVREQRLHAEGVVVPVAEQERHDLSAGLGYFVPAFAIDDPEDD
eukprot:Rhum_TRINITY_DN13244_c0_g1::Rhum_TRINITY_DN13244_c0_g1_i1::g.57979::m.57979